MTELDALLAGIVAHPHEAVRWLIVADWLDDHGFSERAELLRLHRMLIDTCCEPDQHPERIAWQARIVELIDQGVKPCVPQHTLMLPGGVPLVGHFIPPGSFLMGSEETVHKVTLTKGFFMGIYPIAQLQWRAVMGTDPSEFKGDQLPVEIVDSFDADDFCTAATQMTGTLVRLPSEAEWEYACRAGTTTHFYYGDTPDPKRMRFDSQKTETESVDGSSFGQTVAVGSFAPNPWGLFDCHGNVQEWSADWYEPRFFRDRLPEVDPAANRETSWRSTRGGSWSSESRQCTSAYRNYQEPRRRDLPCWGFRVAFALS